MKIGQKIIRLDCVDSTNNYIANLIKEGAISSGSVIMADEQFAGKGQRNAQWLSSAGENLTFSFFLDGVNLSVERQFLLTQIVSLSIVKMLKNREVNAEIKWPNDIYVKNKKIAGILIENQLRGSLIKSIIVGIGLNINQTDFGKFSATSLRLEKDEHCVIHDVLLGFISVFNEKIKEIHSSNLQGEYLGKMYQRNLTANYKDKTGEFEGEIVGVKENGKLILLKNNIEHHYNLKEISFL